MIGAIIQARMGSSRLPGKVMKIIDNEKSMLKYVLDQVKNAKNIKKIIVATTNLHEDNVIEEFVKSQNVSCFRGNPEDVLNRYYNCSKKFNLKSIVRITGDCPLIDPQIMDKVIEKYISGNYDYVSNNKVIVATMDRELKKQIKNLGSSIMSFSNDKIVLES